MSKRVVHGTPAAEIAIDAALVSALVAQQCPEYAGLPVTLFANGWDNAMFRLGEELVVRLPRRELAVQLLDHEQLYLPRLAHLPLAIPVPVYAGSAGCGYPWGWSVIRWVEGETANLTSPLPSQARALADFLLALHQPASPDTDAPKNPYRGCPLSDRVSALTPRFDRLRAQTTVMTPKIEAIWQAALDAPLCTTPVWLHGDLHARNITVDQGRIASVIDWGDICTGDAATDLASIWGLFDDAEARRAALAHYGADEALIARARGWAISFAAVLLDSGMVDNPEFVELGTDIFRRLEAD